MNPNGDNESLVKLRAIVGQMAARGVARAWAFGSRVTGDDTETSDWDILVEFRPDQPPTFARYMGLKAFLEDRLGGKVDLLSRTACKQRFLDAIQDEMVELHAA